MTLTLLDLLNLIAFVVGVTGSIIIAARKSDNRAHLYLSAFVFTSVSGALVPILFRGGIYEKAPFLIYLPFTCDVFSMAFLYAFLKVLSGAFDMKKIGLVFLPPLLITLSYFYFWSHPDTEKIMHLTDGTWGRVAKWYRIVHILYSTIIIIICLAIVNRYEKQVDQFFSQGLPRGFIWVKALCYYVLILYVVNLIPPNVYPGKLYLWTAIIFTLGIICLVLWIVIEGTHQNFQFIPAELSRKSDLDDPIEKLIVDPSHQSKDATMFTQLSLTIEEKKYYRNLDLSLQDLGDVLNISSRRLSNLINQQTGKNFRNFINSFRVEYAKSRIEDGALEDININGLAQDSGFKSRTTFYSAFKLEAGETPLEYMRRKQANKS